MYATMKSESRLSARTIKNSNNSLIKSKSNKKIDKTVYINNFNMNSNKMFLKEFL